MENKFLKLTNTAYKVLEFFPESDPLKNRAKDKALEIMEHLTLINENSGWASFQKEKVKIQLLEDIDILLGYFWIGKSQGWLNSANCLIIANEYEKIKKEFRPIIELTSKLPGIDKPLSAVQELPVAQKPPKESIQMAANPARISHGTSERQKKIIDFLTKNGKGQVMDFQTVLPNVTKRTIRRDMDELLEIGRVKRLGVFNQVFYEIA